MSTKRLSYYLISMKSYLSVLLYSGLCPGGSLTYNQRSKKYVVKPTTRLPRTDGANTLRNYIHDQFPRLKSFKYYKGNMDGRTIVELSADLAPVMFSHIVGKGRLYIGSQEVKPLVSYNTKRNM